MSNAEICRMYDDGDRKVLLPVLKTDPNDPRPMEQVLGPVASETIKQMRSNQGQSSDIVPQSTETFRAHPATDRAAGMRRRLRGVDRSR